MEEGIENQQHIDPRQGQSMKQAPGVQGPEGHPAKEPGRHQHQPDGPGQKPPQEPAQHWGDAAQGADRPHTVKNQGDKRQHQQIRHHTHETDHPKIAGGQGGRQAHGAERNGYGPRQPGPQHLFQLSLDFPRKQEDPQHTQHRQLESGGKDRKGIEHQQHQGRQG